MTFAHAHHLQPPTVTSANGPFIFLAGPIQGAHEWQLDAAAYLLERQPLLWVANPRRERFDMETKKGQEQQYAQQVDWETRMLNTTAKNGVIVFWLPKQTIDVPGRAYAQTTRFELAEWKVQAQYGKAQLALGIEPGFTNERYIRRRFSQDLPQMAVHATMQETLDDALQHVNQLLIKA